MPSQRKLITERPAEAWALGEAEMDRVEVGWRTNDRVLSGRKERWSEVDRSMME